MRKLGLLLAGVLLAVMISCRAQQPLQSVVVKVGTFYGGRVNLFYRTYLHGFFDKEDVSVELYTKNLRVPGIFKIPQNHVETRELMPGGQEGLFGKMSGIEIVDEINRKALQGGTIGETSFVYEINRGSKLIAVAMLGHDTQAMPGKAIVVRKGLMIRSPQDFKNTTIVSRRAGPGDGIFLREFLKDIGMLGEKSIKIIDNVDDDTMHTWLAEGKIDAGLFHLTSVVNVVEKGAGYVYRKMDWMNPELSHAILVFRKDFIQDHPDLVQRVIDAFVRRIIFEREMPRHQKKKTRDKGLMMDLEFEEMTIPQYDLPPLVRVDLLEHIQDLLVEYGYVSKGVDIREFIDNSFVERACRKIQKESPAGKSPKKKGSVKTLNN